MAAPMIRNVFGYCRLLSSNVLSDSVSNARSWTCLQQIRRNRSERRVSWYVKQRSDKQDENLTEENKEFLDKLVSDMYRKEKLTMSPLEQGPWKRNEYDKFTRRTGVLAIKLGIIPQWTIDGRKFTTTLLQIIDNHVIRYTPPEEFSQQAGWKPWWGQKYGSVVVGALSSDPRMFTNEYNNLFMEAGVPPKRKLTRFLVTKNAAIEPGTPLNVMHFRVGDVVDCSAKTIHHGFQGVIKKWGMKGMPNSHGVTKARRKMGTVAGGKYRGGIWKGKKMPGIMGGKWRTLKGLKVWRINTKYNVLYVQGQNIPGSTHGYVRIMDTILPLRKPHLDNSPPMPTWYPEDTPDHIQEEYQDKDLFKFTDESVRIAEE